LCNFNVNFSIFLSKSVVHPLANKRLDENRVLQTLVGRFHPFTGHEGL